MTAKNYPKRALLLFFAISLVACSGESKKPAVTATVINVATVKAQRIDFTETSIGSLSSVSAPVVRAETSGRIIKLLADIGQSVKKGQLLALLDPTDNQNAVVANSAQAAQLKAQLDFQKLTVARMRKLIKTGVITQANLDEASAKLLSLAEQLKSASAQANTAAYQLKRNQIVAPVDGQIQSRMVSEGDFINTGAPVFEIITLNPLRATLPFPETVSSLLAVGQAVKLTTPLLPHAAITSTIKQLTPLLDTSNRSTAAIIEFPNPGGWQPGASVRGDVVVKTESAAIMVPLECVVERPQGAVVYVVQKDHVREQAVFTGKIVGNFIEIQQKTGTALKQGDIIAKDGAAYLTDQATVEVRP